MGIAEEFVRLLSVQAPRGRSDVVGQIHGPSKKLLHDNSAKCSKRSIFSHLIKCFELFGSDAQHLGILLCLGWDIVVVLAKVVCVDVVTTVR